MLPTKTPRSAGVHQNGLKENRRSARPVAPQCPPAETRRSRLFWRRRPAADPARTLSAICPCTTGTPLLIRPGGPRDSRRNRREACRSACLHVPNTCPGQPPTSRSRGTARQLTFRVTYPVFIRLLLV